MTPGLRNDRRRAPKDPPSSCLAGALKRQRAPRRYLRFFLAALRRSSRFVAAVTRSQAVFAGLALDDTVPHPKHGSVDVRWVMIHMIEEYAQHNGHADIIRELIDGTTQS